MLTYPTTLLAPPGGGIVASDLVCHLDASLQAGVTFKTTEGDGELISSWDDQSGNGNDFDAPNGSEPDWIANAYNSLGAVLFSRASAEYLQNTSPFLSGSSQDGHIFIVHRSTDAAGDNSGWMRFGSDSLEDQFTWSISSRVFSGFGSSARKDCGIPTEREFFHLAEIHSANNDWEFLQNGSSEFSTASSTRGWNATSFFLGRSDTLYGGFEMGEIAIYSAKKTGADLAAIRSYLNTKWNL